jgi:rubrerythrin
MSIPNLILTYVVTQLTVLTAAAIYSEMRRRSFEPAPTRDRVFRCQRCGYVYTDDPDVDRSRCSQCGQTNEPIAF